MGKASLPDPATAMMEATMEGFRQVKIAIDAVQEAQKIQARATYKGLTGHGKARYVNELVQAHGSQVQVANLLDLSPGRINQLVHSEKNLRNGK